MVTQSEEPVAVAGGGAGTTGGGVNGGRETFTLVASSSVTNNAELHYILTSIYDINLVERCLRDVVMLEESGHGWPDLQLDERTCVLLQPLHQLRTDTHLHQLTCQMVLLSLQCTTCYTILYSHPPANSGYVFRSGVLKALARLVATCALFRSPDYTVTLLLAHNLHQVGEMVRRVGEATMAASTCWDKEEWTTRPWLTPQMSSHERFLLSLPCINSISAQVILTAMSLPDVLTLPLASLLSALPWIPHKVTKMLHRLLHGAVTDVTSYDVDVLAARSVTSSPCVGEGGVEPTVMEVCGHPHPDGVAPTVMEVCGHPHPDGQPHPREYGECKDNGERTQVGYTGRPSFVDGRSHYDPDHTYEGDREGSSVVFPTCTTYGNDTLLPVYNIASAYSNGLYSDCGSRAANDPNSLNTAEVLSADRLSGDLFNAKAYLTSATSADGTSLEYPQKMSPLQQISVVQQIPHTQHRPRLLSESEQYQPMLQLQQLMPCQPPTLQQHKTTLTLSPASHLCQPLPQMDQSAPRLKQLIPQPCQPILQLQQSVPQLHQSTSQSHKDKHVQNYYPHNEESLVVSPYFPESRSYYSHQAGNQNIAAVNHPQQELHPNMASASKLVTSQYSDICLLSDNGDQMLPLHSGEAQCNNNIPGYRSDCGNLQQLQLQQQHEQRQHQLQQQQQQQQQHQQQQEHQQMQNQYKYWKESPSLHHQPLNPRSHGNKVLGVAKPYQWYGSESMPVPPSPKVTLRQEGRGHDIPEEYDLAMSQVRGTGSSQVRGTWSSQVGGTWSSQVGGTGSSQVRGTGSSQVRGTGSSQVRGTGSSQVRGTGSSQLLSTQEVKKLIYQKVPGRGGQTQLAFKPI